MAKFSVLKNAVIPTKRTGAKKNLLKKDGIASDGLNDNDDDSSSLSERQEKKKPRSKKKFPLQFLRRMGMRNGAAEEDGYESDANASNVSTGSTRSTSSSFLRYQNRAIWRAKLMKKSVLRRLGDGTEAPMEEETKWPLFDRIYKRQNQVRKNGELGDEEDREYDEDSVSSDDPKGDTRPLGPPAPITAIGIDEEAALRRLCEDEGASEAVAERDLPQRGVSTGGRSFGDGRSPEKGSEKSKEQSSTSQEASEKDSDQKTEAATQASAGAAPESASSSSSPMAVPESDVHTAVQKEPGDTQSADTAKKYLEGSLLADSSAARVQESGIPTSEPPRKEAAAPLATQPRTPPKEASKSPAALPTPQLTPSSTRDITAKEKKPGGGRVKSSRKSRQKNKVSDEERAEITPLSLPRTICYSLRSAIGDGSARQRNSHSLMERRPLRPNGCHLDTSYWSHRGKRNYMEDRFVIEHIGKDSDSQPISLLAVFDGHGGSLVSNFCSDWISAYIRKKNKYFPASLGLAMKTAFIKADADFVSSGHFDGTTACACAVAGNKVVCCNAGDSRAIIVRRDGTAVALSEDHKPELMRETKRINALGGRVIHWGRWRVEGVLAVSRSIGDARLKPYVTAEPDIIEHELGEQMTLTFHI